MRKKSSSIKTHVHISGIVAEAVKVKRLNDETVTIDIGEYPADVTVFIDPDELRTFARILNDALDEVHPSSGTYSA
jgi:uncharacterized membrane protein